MTMKFNFSLGGLTTIDVFMKNCSSSLACDPNFDFSCEYSNINQFRLEYFPVKPLFLKIYLHQKHDMTWHNMTWHDMTWHDMTWHDMTWHDMTWHGVTWPDMGMAMTWDGMAWQWHYLAIKWHDMTWAWHVMTYDMTSFLYCGITLAFSSICNINNK